MEGRVIWIFCLRFKSVCDVFLVRRGGGEIVVQQPMRYHIRGGFLCFAFSDVFFFFSFSCTSTNY